MTTQSDAPPAPATANGSKIAEPPRVTATAPAAVPITTAIVPVAQDPVAAADEPGRAISAFSSEVAFKSAQRMANALASSTLVPKEYQNNIPNVLIAMELANRIGASVFMVMQNLDVIHGRPGWRSLFLIATVNSSGRFTPLRFKFEGKPGTDDWGCRAVAKDKSDGEPCPGALITIGLAKAEGWVQKSGSKWRTMPEQMLMYRSAAFWVRIYAPELSVGMQTREEVIDTTGVEVPDAPEPQITTGDARALESALLGRTPPRVTSDGEVLDREPGQEG